MAQIIQFKKPNLEDRFLSSLDEEQCKLFFEILEEIQAEFTERMERMELAYTRKCVECEELKIELEVYKK